MRRAGWLTVGAVLGVSGTLWSRRRVEDLAHRARSGAIAGDMARLVDRGWQRVDRRLAGAVETGRQEARRRRHELRRAYDPRPSPR